MRSVLRLNPLFLAGLFILASCNRTYDPTPEYATRLFPLEDGKYRIYHVVDTVFETAVSSEYEVQTFYKREMVDGTETDLLDREVSKLWIYKSPDTLGTPDNPVYNWDFYALWTMYNGEQYAERTEGNTRYLVLKNPVYPDASWNGNLFNDQGQKTYRYTNIDTTVTVQGVTYDNCVFVLQQEFYQPFADSAQAIFISDYQYEIYAPDIGMILRYYKTYRRESNSVIADKSRIFREEVVEHNFQTK